MHRSQTRCENLLDVTAEALDEDADALLETDSFTLSDTSSIASYKTERTINSYTCRNNYTPIRRKGVDTGHPRLPLDVVSEDFDGASVLEVCKHIGRRDSQKYIRVIFQRDLEDDSFSSSRSMTPIAPKANFVGESGPSAVTQTLDWPFEIRGSSTYGFSIVV